MLAPRWDTESNLTSACQLLSFFRNKDALGISDFALLHEESKALKAIGCAAGQSDWSLSAWELLVGLQAPSGQCQKLLRANICMCNQRL